MDVQTNRRRRGFNIILILALAASLQACPLSPVINSIKNKIIPPAQPETVKTPAPAAPPAVPAITAQELETRVEEAQAEGDLAGAIAVVREFMDQAGAIAVVREFMDQAGARPGRENDLALGNETLAFIYARGRELAAPAHPEVRPGGVLYIRDCNPMADPFFCNIGPDLDRVQPFFDQFKRTGRAVTIKVPADFSELFLYDLVIVDACSRANLAPWFDQVPLYIFAGGRALVLGDYRCGAVEASAETANRILMPIGLNFTAHAESAAAELPVFSDHPYLIGVTTVSVSGVAPLTARVNVPVQPIIVRPDGRVLMAEVPYGLGRSAAWGDTGILTDPNFSSILYNILRDLPARPDAITPDQAAEVEARVKQLLAEDRILEAIKTAAGFLTKASQAPDAGAEVAEARQLLAASYARALGLARELNPETPDDVLYTDDCDPRVDPSWCGRAETADDFGPFFQAFDRAGQTVALAVPATFEELFRYRLVIVDACSSVADGDIINNIQWYVYAGGTVLVLGDNYCHRDGVNSSRRADPLMRPVAMAFSDDDPTDLEIIAVTSPHPWLEGVRQMDVYRVTPIVLDDPADPALTIVLARPDGRPLLVSRELGLGRVIAWGGTGTVYEPNFVPILYNIIRDPAGK